MAKKKKEVKESEVTDILQEFFMEDGVEKTKRIYMSGSKVVKEDIVNS